MARKKTRLAYIAGAAARNATLRKRRVGLLKKVNELSILCDVPACAIIYAPNVAQPEVWPSPEAATALLHQFNAGDGVAKANNMMDQEKFLAKRLVKVRTQIRRVMAENADLSGELLLRQCLDGRPFSGLDFYELGSVERALYCRAEAVKAMIMQISLNVNDKALQPPPPLLLPPPLFSPEAEAGFRMDRSLAFEEIQNQYCLIAPKRHEAAPPACGMPEIESEQGIFIESSEMQYSGELAAVGRAIAARTEAAEAQLHHPSKDSGGGAPQPSTPLLLPPPLILSPVEVGVQNTDDFPAAEFAPSQRCLTDLGGCYDGAAALGYDLPEIGGFGFSSKQELGTASENYLPTWEEFQSYFFME